MKKTWDSSWTKTEKFIAQALNSPSFHRSTEFDYKRDTKYLTRVLQGFVKSNKFDLYFILRFFSSHNCDQRLVLVRGLEYEHGCKLIQMVLEQPESPARSCTIAMLIDPIELCVRDFHHSLILERIDEHRCDTSRTLVEILLGLNNREIQKFKELYEFLFKNSVERDIGLIYDQKSIISKLLLQFLEGKRYEIPAHSASVARTIANQLHEVGEGTSDIDFDMFIQMFTQDAFSQLSAIFDAYEDRYGQSMRQVIEHEIPGQLEVECFQDMIDYTRSPCDYYSRILHRALDRSPIDYKTFMRVIVNHQGKDLCEIKLEYSKIFDETLDQTVENRIDITSIKTALLTMISDDKTVAPGPCDQLQSNRKTKSIPNSLTASPIVMSNTPVKKNRSQEAFEKLVQIFKKKRQR